MVILCVDPDTQSLDTAQERLSDSGYETMGVGSGERACAHIEGDTNIDCLVTEWDLPNTTGLSLVKRIRETEPDASCILYTSKSIDEIDSEAFAGVIAEYVSKDAIDSVDELVRRVEQTVELRSQTAYPLPSEEDSRLESLAQYADDPEELEQSFSRLTEIATALFGVEGAAVGLVGEHEEQFLSCHGIGFDRLQRENTICTYAILDEEVMVVEDVLDDPRFSNNKQLADEDVRFYASTSLTTPEGYSIGSFCVFHSEPNTFSERERELLQLLAEDAMEQLELRQQLTEQENHE